MSAPETSLVGHFSILEDPRDALRRRHHLLDRVVVAIAATLGGADGWVDIAQFGRAKEAWFRRFPGLPDGIPSYDTFGRVFSRPAPEAFEACFRAWVASIRTVIPGEIIAVDGKTLRRSHDRSKGVAALHPVGAWATANRVVLGQVATAAKSNEITAIPQLLELPMLEGTIVTIDAMGCRTKIAEQIIDQGADDVLALKGNQGVLAAEVEEAFIEADAKNYSEIDSAALDTVERGHGRVETRRYRTLGDLSGVPRSALWKGMNMIGMVESTRESDGKVSRETRFFIGSIGTGVADFGRAVRGPRGVENELHWSLDVAMREDDCRVRETRARENLAVLRHIAMSRLKHDGTKLGIKTKRLKAGWDDAYLEKLLFEAPPTLRATPPSGASNVSRG